MEVSCAFQYLRNGLT
ncbi:hypothetical protein Zm00014a_040846 [Zea mays]|uniref:Uncharacterized protein n=1 Tax=Zea mays TaxID=4577 RepID=A0A317Y5P3_MAIZE|nr:hypothetical protein Zm00014a_040846 [Zea mays]